MVNIIENSEVSIITRVNKQLNFCNKIGVQTLTKIKALILKK